MGTVKKPVCCTDSDVKILNPSAIPQNSIESVVNINSEANKIKK